MPAEYCLKRGSSDDGLAFSCCSAAVPRRSRRLQCPTRRTHVSLVACMSAKRPVAGENARGRTWKCVSNCGACCWLGDYDEDTLLELLKTPDDVETYLGMVGADGWCRHFDKSTRRCSVYADRPRFCRVDLDVFESLYGVEDVHEFNDFAIECCETHISEVYPCLDGENQSPEMARFQNAISAGKE